MLREDLNDERFRKGFKAGVTIAEKDFVSYAMATHKCWTGSDFMSFLQEKSRKAERHFFHNLVAMKLAGCRGRII